MRKLTAPWIMAALLLNACGATPEDEAAAQRGQDLSLVGVLDPLASVLDPFDAYLAALAADTLSCLGTVNPLTFAVTSDGFLAPRFQGCPVGGDVAWRHLTDRLALQSAPAAPDARLKMVSNWNAYLGAFPLGLDPLVCPGWRKIQIINAPTSDTIGGRVQEENYVWSVGGSAACLGDPACNVTLGLICGDVGGSQFLAGSDPNRGTITTDPSWWLTHYTYASDADNPFMSPGYYHQMATSGSYPGAQYGALERDGEACSKYINGWLYKNRRLGLIMCGSSYCATMCQ
jgi:hypothetical protein